MNRELHERLGDLWQGEWPYSAVAGVGMRLDGYPTNEDEFYRICGWESCHPDASTRILARIKQNGFDLLTVMSHLPFKQLSIDLATIGVKLSIIEPQENWRQRFENVGAYPTHLLPPRMR